MSQQNCDEAGVLRTTTTKKNASLQPNGRVFFSFCMLKQVHLDAYFIISSILSVTQGETVKIPPFVEESSTCKLPAGELRPLIAFSIRGDVNKRF